MNVPIDIIYPSVDTTVMKYITAPIQSTILTSDETNILFKAYKAGAFGKYGTFAAGKVYAATVKEAEASK